MTSRTPIDWLRKLIAAPVYIVGIGLFALGYFILRIAEHIEGKDEIDIPTTWGDVDES